jgi:hypothetical protein
LSDEHRPWWASTGEGHGAADDPVVAHRAARRGAAASTGMPDTDEDPSPDADEAHAEAICGVCPICMLARTLEDTHPELLGHLTEAARHLAAAARAMLDPGQHDAGPDTVQRIDLD